jgi:hypothetical protein
MAHLILLAALVLYAIALLLALRSVGLGLTQVLASGVMTIAFVWSALYLVYVSDVLHAAGLIEIPPSVASVAVPYGWLWRYAAENGWVVGIVYYLFLWLVAALIRVLQPSSNRVSGRNPLGGSA